MVGDHHPRAFFYLDGWWWRKSREWFMVRPMSLAIISLKNPVHVNDFHATILHLLGLNHEQLTYKHLGRRYRLTDVAGNVIPDIIA